MTKGQILSILNKIAPSVLAEPWDNTGLLIEALTSPLIYKIFLTVDLTPLTLSECLQRKANFVVAYHPVLFKPLKKIDLLTCPEVIHCIANGISVYSPHTVRLWIVPRVTCDYFFVDIGLYSRWKYVTFT